MTDESTADLRRRWQALVGSSPSAVTAGDELLDRWSEPHRRHHTTTHLCEVLDAVDVLAHEAADPETVRLGAWFHDAVYDGRPGDDEQASATLARTMLTALGMPAARVAEVGRLVLLTRTHDPRPGDRNGAVLCDADLAVLGASADRYAAYASAVREEYRHVSDEHFVQGRADVLRTLVARRRLYTTAPAQQRWEAAARRNLTAELRLLELLT